MARSDGGSQCYDYFLVLDFETTCEQKTGRYFLQEVIEFAVLKVNGRTLEVESTFHKFVAPEVNPQLTPFCVQLLGITQSMVDGQPNITTTLSMFDQWMESEGLLDPGVNFVFVTCGDFDLKYILPRQCEHLSLTYPSYLKKPWIDVQVTYAAVTDRKRVGLQTMLSEQRLSREGRQHSAVDDCRNLLTVMEWLVFQARYVLRETSQLDY